MLGLGGVSSSFLQIHAKTAALQSKFLISALANSRFSLLAPKQIPAVDVSAWVTAHPDRKPLDVLSLLTAVQADSRGPVIVVDNSSSPDLAALYPAILKSGASVCTPNKKSTSSSLKLYEEILTAAEGDKAGLYYGESTVGAGLPILSTLKELVATGDEIIKVEGVLSGTRPSFPVLSMIAEPDTDLLTTPLQCRTSSTTTRLPFRRRSPHRSRPLFTSPRSLATLSPTRATTSPESTSPASSRFFRVSCPRCPRRSRMGSS